MDASLSLRSQPLAQSTLIVAPAGEWASLWSELSASAHMADRWTPPTLDKAPTVAMLRELHAHASVTPVRSHKVAAVPQADILSREVANSLLKVLEEPPSFFWTVLFAESENVLPTIKSRVRVLRFDGQAGEATSRQRLGSLLSTYRLTDSRQRSEAAELLYLTPLIHATVQLPVIEEAFGPL